MQINRVTEFIPQKKNNREKLTIRRILHLFICIKVYGLIDLWSVVDSYN